MWLGGAAPVELRRVGRHGDGWLPSFTTPEDAARGRAAIEAEAAAHGRSIDPEHYGALIPYLAEPGPLPDLIARAVAARRPDLDPSAVVPTGLDGLRSAIEAFVAVGFSKFVPLPVTEPDDWGVHLAEVAGAVLDLSTSRPPRHGPGRLSRRR